MYLEKELLTDLTAIVTLSRECEALLLAVDDHFRNVSTVVCCDIVRADIKYYVYSTFKYLFMIIYI